MYYIFEGENFTDLPVLLNYYMQYGLKPQSQQAYPVSDQDFIQQQNLRGSRMLARLSHVKLLYPIKPKRGRSSVQVLANMYIVK